MGAKSFFFLHAALLCAAAQRAKGHYVASYIM
jgi:hypothetical protein